MKQARVRWAAGAVLGGAIGTVVACTDATEPLTENAGTDASVGGSAGSSGAAGSAGFGGGGAGGNAGSSGAAGSAGNGGTWSATGSMAEKRGFFHMTTTLLSGKVLVAGGMSPKATKNEQISTAELYDPDSGTWSAAAAMGMPRASACAALLPSGKVLMAGGSSYPTPGGQDTAELYDPDADTWTPITQKMAAVHDLGACAVLQSGKVFLVGGLNLAGDSSNVVAELYDPAAGIFVQTGSMATARYWHTITVLASGKVLVVGGKLGWAYSDVATSSAELFDPVTELWSNAGDLPVASFGHTATLLPSGKVLVAGGCASDDTCGPDGALDGEASKQAYLYDPTAGTWSAIGEMRQMHAGHEAFLLTSGDVLLVGGSSLLGAEFVTERYNTTAGVWEYGPKPPVNLGHYFGSAKLQNGKWIVVGGLGPRADGKHPFAAAAEIFTE